MGDSMVSGESGGVQLVGRGADRRIAASASSCRPNGGAGHNVLGAEERGRDNGGRHDASIGTRGAGGGNAGGETLPHGGQAAGRAGRRRRLSAARFLSDPLRVIGQRLSNARMSSRQGRFFAPSFDICSPLRVGPRHNIEVPSNCARGRGGRWSASVGRPRRLHRNFHPPSNCATSSMCVKLLTSSGRGAVLLVLLSITHELAAVAEPDVRQI
jgi:hypothetical protein